LFRPPHDLLQLLKLLALLINEQLRVTNDVDEQDVAEIGCVNALLNKRDEAHNAIEELKARAAHEYIGETLIVYIYLALGDKEQAFAWIEEGYQSRAGNLLWLEMEPKFDPVRSDRVLLSLLGEFLAANLIDAA